jgi:hypothetical protein
MFGDLQHLAEEGFGGPRVSFCAEYKVNRLACGIDSAVEVVVVPKNRLAKVTGVRAPGFFTLQYETDMQMSARTIIGIIFFCVAMTGAFLGNMTLIMMIGEINRKRQEGNLISYFGFTFPKMLRIFREYRSLYPDGKLHIYNLAALAIMVIGTIGVAVCIGIIG